MAIERRVTEIAGAGRRQAAHRALAQRPGRDRRRDVRRATRHCDAAVAALERWPRRCSSSPSGTSTGRCPATPTCSARSPSTSATTCSPTSGCCCATATASARCSPATGALPLGAGALAGVNFDTDRELVAAELGFAGVAENSIDAVSNRDFVLDYLAAAATCATHLSRLGAEIVLWSSEEFGFCEVSDAWASGSSIMPQKKNPDAAELLRAKAPRVVGAPGRAARRDARPAADLQQGHAGGQGAPVRRGRHARAVPRRRRRDARHDHVQARAPGRGGRATSSSPRPTSPTCWSGAACRSARPTASSPGSCGRRSSSGKPLSELTPRGAGRAVAAARRRVLRAARGWRVARVEGLRGRHQPRRACASSSSARAPRSRRTVKPVVLRPAGARGRRAT